MFKVCRPVLLVIILSCLLTPVIRGNVYASVEDPMNLIPPDLKYLEWVSDQEVQSYDDYLSTIPGREVVLPAPVAAPDKPYTGKIYVVVEETLWSQVDQSRILRYQQDIESDGYSCAVWSLSASASHISLRNWLRFKSEEISDDGGNLVGCILIGEIQAAWFEMDYQKEPGAEYTHEEFPIDLYYMDLDGSWDDEDEDGIYDVHEDADDGGDIAPDIWVGRLRADNLSGDEVQLVENYFDKNHDYRRGELSLLQSALVYIDDDWTPDESAEIDVSLAYSAPVVCDQDAETTRDHYLDTLEDGWTFVHLMSHGWSGGHKFKVPDPENPGASVVDGYVLGYGDINVIDPPVFFYNLFVCSGARFTSENCLGSWCVFAPEYGLAAVGSTKTGSMKAFGGFYTPLGMGATLGEAFLTWFERYSENDRPWYYGMTVLGDPTLRPAGKHAVSFSFDDLREAVGAVRYYEGGVEKTGDVTGGEWSGLCDHGSPITVVTLEHPHMFVDATTRVTPFSNQWIVSSNLPRSELCWRQKLVTLEAINVPAAQPITLTYWVNGEQRSTEGISMETPFTGWCDLETVEAPREITVSETEKLQMICWTIDDERFPSTPLTLEEDTETISAQYIGLSKHQSKTEASLGEKVTVTLNVNNPSTGTENDWIVISDDLPNEMSYLTGSAEIDGAPHTPSISDEDTPDRHQRLKFIVDGIGEHIISYDCIINRAYQDDAQIQGTTAAEIHYVGVPTETVHLLPETTIHPYLGGTLSKSVCGPEEVTMFSAESWVFSFAVTNNYVEPLTEVMLTDNFPAELVIDPASVTANPESEVIITTSKGRSDQARLQWSIPDMEQGESFLLQLTAATGCTPSKTPKQQYASPGVKTLNKGATLKWRINDEKQSTRTGPITVYVLQVK